MDILQNGLQTMGFGAGVNIVLLSSDMFLFSQKLKEDMARMKEAAGDTTLEHEDAYQKKLKE